ncbi:MAG: YhdP family protein, partial [Thiothrix sp.]
IFNLAALPLPQLHTYGLQHGALRLDARLQAAPDKPLQIHGEGELIHVGWQGNNSVPALDGVNATFSANNSGGKVQVNLKGSTLNYPAWFDRPLRLDKVAADLEWVVREQGWQWSLSRLAARNQDLQVSATGKLAIPRKQQATIDLNLQFATQRRLDNVRDYIPAIVPETTAHWLKTAIVHGSVPKGEMLLRGELANFPFDKNPGEFNIRFDIEQGVLAYLPEWPAAHEVSGELRFHNASMTAKVHRAKIKELAVQGGTVEIPDMHHNAQLYLDLNTQGELKAHMDYLQATPIGRNLQDFMRVAEFSGRSALRLRLNVPLEQAVLDKQGVAVDGTVTLENNRFALPEYHQMFDKLTGQVQFDQHGVTVQQARGEYRTQPFTLKAHTDKAQHRILLELQQRNNPMLFLPQSFALLKPYVQGQAAVTTRLTLPAFDATPNQRTRLLVQAESDLRGVRI